MAAARKRQPRAGLRERAAETKASAERVIRRKSESAPQHGSDHEQVRRPAAASPALLAMVDRWSSLLKAINSEELDDAEVDRLGNEHNALQMAVYRFPAESAADLKAKIPVFMDEMKAAVGALHPNRIAEETLAGAAWLALFRDFARLAEAGASRSATERASGNGLPENRRLAAYSTAMDLEANINRIAGLAATLICAGNSRPMVPAEVASCLGDVLFDAIEALRDSWHELTAELRSVA